MSSWVLRLTIVAVAALTSAAAADCTCRAKNVVASQGEVVCLATPQGERMARCDKVLNNASWTFLEGPCPAPVLAGPSPDARSLERLAAAAPTAAGR
jgi:hypothetical protein